MAHYEDDMRPASRIVAGAIGEPGRRTFILQAHYGSETLSWVMDKEQVVSLGRQIAQLLADIRSEFPELGEPLVAAEPNLTLREPLHPEFRIGALGVGYDRSHDLVVLTLVDARGQELDLQALLRLDLNRLAANEAPPEEMDAPQGHEIYATRGQAWLLSQQAEAVVAAGRPLCPACGEPMDSFGHFCLPPASRRRTGGAIVQ